MKPHLRLVHSKPEDRRVTMVELRSFNWPIVLALVGCIAFHAIVITAICSAVDALNDKAAIK